MKSVCQSNGQMTLSISPQLAQAQIMKLNFWCGKQPTVSQAPLALPFRKDWCIAGPKLRGQQAGLGVRARTGQFCVLCLSNHLSTPPALFVDMRTLMKEDLTPGPDPQGLLRCLHEALSLPTVWFLDPEQPPRMEGPLSDLLLNHLPP